MKNIFSMSIIIVFLGCATISLKERQSKEILLGTWESRMIIGTKLTFTFLRDGGLKTNFGDDGVLTWDLHGNILTFYENGEVDDVVFLTIINKNKFIIKDEQTDDGGMAFNRKITAPK